MSLQSQYSWAQQSPAVPLSCPAQREVQSGPDDVNVDVVVCCVVSGDVEASVDDRDVVSASQHSGLSKHP